MRQAKAEDLTPGKYVHYWGQVRQILSVSETLITLTDDHAYNKRILLTLPNEFVLTTAPKTEDNLIDDLYD